METINMEALGIYPFDPVDAKLSEVIELMKKNRGGNILIRFFYEGYVYDAGVHTENGSSGFFLDDQLYPGMFAFLSSACIEGVLVSDFTDKVKVLAVNNENPSDFF